MDEERKEESGESMQSAKPLAAAFMLPLTALRSAASRSQGTIHSPEFRSWWSHGDPICRR